MTFEDYLRTVVPKIGPNSAFDLSRDARLKAYEALLIDKGIATQAEIDAELEKQLGETAQHIVTMPTISQPTPPIAHDSEATNTN